MRCIYCGSDDTRVVDSRPGDDGYRIRRRRACNHCGQRFSTVETPEWRLPSVVKSDGTRQDFDADKVRASMQMAARKRPVSADALNARIDDIVNKLRAYADAEIPSRQLGEWVMEALKSLDHVAYVRFASVYRQFDDLQTFREEIERLEQELPHDIKLRQLSLLDPDSDPSTS